MRYKWNIIVSGLIVIQASLVLQDSVASEGSNKSERPKHAENGMTISRDAEGKVRQLSAAKGQVLQLDTARGESLHQSVAKQFAPHFGINNPVRDLKVTKQIIRQDSGTHIRYQQQYNGVPVIAAELVANVTATNQLMSMSGETAPALSVNTTPTVSAQQAIDTALAAVAKWHKLDMAELNVSAPVLSIYKSDLISPNNLPPSLVWQLEVTPKQLKPLREYMLIDAQRGFITLHINKVDTVRNRVTYTANNGKVLPGTQLCSESDTDCGDSDATAAHAYAGDTYDFYFNTHGRDSYNDLGATITSSVHYGSNFKNAAWNGTQMVYGDGFSQADDVVAHEITHAVTEKTSNLFYYYQSGAISESFSDLWGEFVDQTNGAGTDTPAVKWLMGEDLPGIGAVRNMSNPPAFGQPDKMTSANYFIGTEDNGGVHYNSGINNKAVYLMVDGNSFNGQNITGIGINKTATIYYATQLSLTSGSDYLDLYNALNTACTGLVGGTEGITTADCTQVTAALDAVEMNQQPVDGYNIEASICPAGSTVSTTVFSDDFETGLASWSRTHDITLANSDWVDWFAVYGGTAGPYAASGTKSMFGENINLVADQYASISVNVPSTDIPYLYFKQAFQFEAVFDADSNNNFYYDGGRLEISTDGGSSWTDASTYIADGRGYSGIISSNYGNPLAGNKAFVGSSNGYGSTRVNLVDFAGQTIQIRWRVATDSSLGELGWFLDDVQVYACAGAIPDANAGPDQLVNKAALVTLDGSASAARAGTSITSYLWSQVGGSKVILTNASSTTPSFTTPGTNGILVFKLTVTANNGLSETDIVYVTVNGSPVANAGPDQTVTGNTTVTLNALTAKRASEDSDGSITSYRWTQSSGPTVTLNNANTTAPRFTAPMKGGTLVFLLTVTDNSGATGTDTVTISVSVGQTNSGRGCSISQTGGRFDPFMPGLLLMLTLLQIIRKVRAGKTQ